MKTSEVLARAQKKVTRALEMVRSNRADAASDNFSDYKWFETISGMLEEKLDDLMDDIAGAKDDVITMEREVDDDPYDEGERREFGLRVG